MVMSLLLRLLLFVLIIRALWRLIAGIIQGASGAPAEKGIPLVRDPVCGTFVVRSRALTAGTGSDTHYFCSERCRDAFRLNPGMRQA
ncbi:MAG: hypothetical protein HYX76_02555 [Acidobacteria bacterium]|nr:hypothetical protein [Acidobacteriota bacterium]